MHGCGIRPTVTAMAQTSPAHAVPPLLSESAAFGAGGSEPYARALTQSSAVLELHDVRPPARARPVAVGRFVRPADEVDRRALSRARGPVLDVGCGPGRMVAAAIRQSLPALGVDVSGAAVRLARAAGLPVLRRSVFDPMPFGRTFATVLLLDGNVGIGGSVVGLLTRCRSLLAAGGNVVAEVDSQPEADRMFTGVLRSGDGRSSDPFPWAEVGHQALTMHGRRVGMELVEVWSDGGRHFAELARSEEPEAG